MQAAERDSRCSLAEVFVNACRRRDQGDIAGAMSLLEGFEIRVAEDSFVEIHGNRISAPKVSVVVVSHKHNSDVSVALEQISRQCSSSDTEVVLVANGNDQFHDTGKAHFRNFVGVRSPFPIGCSAGRNLGAEIASSPLVIFLDDDGFIEPGCIAALLNCLEETNAIAVRGKVLPKTLGRGAAHYDLGNERAPSLITCEGISIWRRVWFLNEGGFNPLLAGHEGLELCAKSWRFCGPLAFFYEPNAILRHDFTGSNESAEQKIIRQDRLKSIINFSTPLAVNIQNKTNYIRGDISNLYMSNFYRRKNYSENNTPVSILTTARNSEIFLEEYTRSWSQQSNKNFEIIFVDDGSNDNTVDKAKYYWVNDERFILIKQDFKGRSAALNNAFSNASYEICLIADIDDLSVPSRISDTVNFFSNNPDMDYMSFLTFNENNLFRIGPPHSPFVDDMDIRCLFGMPAAFPAFACRRSKFTESFREDIVAGVDCDWLKRNIEKSGVKGRLVHVPNVYYRQHSGQITENFKEAQQKSRSEIIYYSFGRVLGTLSEEDKRFVDVLSSNRRITSSEKNSITMWMINFLNKNLVQGVFNQGTLSSVFFEAHARVPQTSSQDGYIQSLRRKAEIHIGQGEFKLARRALREAFTLSKNPEVRRRLISAHRWRIVRYIMRSKPFR